MPAPALTDMAPDSSSKIAVRILSILVFNFASYLAIGSALATCSIFWIYRPE